MTNIVVFNSVEDLCNLTNLSERNLSQYGFETTNLEWGFRSDCCFGKLLPDEFGGVYHSHEPIDNIHPMIQIVFNWMDTYCYLYEVVEYDNKFYFLIYHK